MYQARVLGISSLEVFFQAQMALSINVLLASCI